MSNKATFHPAPWLAAILEPIPHDSMNQPNFSPELQAMHAKTEAMLHRFHNDRYAEQLNCRIGRQYQMEKGTNATWEGAPLGMDDFRKTVDDAVKAINKGFGFAVHNSVAEFINAKPCPAGTLCSPEHVRGRFEHCTECGKIA